MDFMKVYSIIREEEYKKLSSLSLDGSVLDLGGNVDSEYHALIKGGHKITSVNVDPKHGCDLVFDIQEHFPIENEKFDAAISMNVFEHIYGFQNAFSETFRVLKKGGTFVFATPFMHHIHGCPDDYMRYTNSTLEKILKVNGFKDVNIQEIGFGVFSLIYQTCSGMLPTFLKPFFKVSFVTLDKVLLKLSKRYVALAERIPLGYFVIAKK